MTVTDDTDRFPPDEELIAGRNGVTALVIPAAGPVREVQLSTEDEWSHMQALVGGLVEAIPLPKFIDPTRRSMAYLNEEGKFDPACKFNMHATDFLVPGIGLFPDDYITGSLVLVGFDPSTGEHVELPQSVIDRVCLIEAEC
jgi:hypothetical protein